MAHRRGFSCINLRDIPSARRFVSTFYTYTSQQANHTVRARIPLLKSPLYLGHYSSRVNRPYNEDRYFAGVLELPAGSTLSPMITRQGKLGVRQVFNFAVFDGHGGEECAQFLKDNLAEYVEKCNIHSADEIAQKYKENIGGYWKRWRGGFEQYISKMSTMDDLQLRIPTAFLTADYDFVQKNATSGSTCTSVYLYSEDPNHAFWEAGQASHLIVAHVGDTRCIICDRFGEAHPLTSNHHPSSPIEASRLRKYTASFFTDSFGESRFGSYANTRAFGDLRAKAQGITAEPDIIENQIGRPHLPQERTIGALGGDEGFLVIVSDGVTGLVSDQEMADIVMRTASMAGSGRGTPQQAAEEIVKYAEVLGGDDNATCLVVRLSGWNKWPQGFDRTQQLREERLKDTFDGRRGRR
ncbi:similar to Saccharomyces cerevisiae YCR079W PTC6 Mitochondrial type 2C protein phosphatase (PP2C) with similarity to mammalian PP1Ks [Geotrichum candidum]|nr:similar to Saccharomyces cerevisiae YCR079W PTC6 Mitochondrial type 2C protein phosphatase (PP2C) with similarity to mammalian PP1Ks [Geotrichum candidum]